LSERRAGDNQTSNCKSLDHDFPPLLLVVHSNNIIWSIVCIDTSTDQGEGLARDNYPLANAYWPPIFETNDIYGVADPRVSASGVPVLG
jgi:hypothetical protein